MRPADEDIARVGVEQGRFAQCTICITQLAFLMLLLCLGYVAPMGVSMACTMWCFNGLNYATACACLYDTSMLASMMYVWAITRSLSLLVANSSTAYIQAPACIINDKEHMMAVLTINTIEFEPLQAHGP
jgi:hypothetical protein